MEGKEINMETTAPTQMSGLTTTSHAAAVKGNSPHEQEIQQLRTQLQERDDAMDVFLNEVKDAFSQKRADRSAREAEDEARRAAEKAGTHIAFAPASQQKLA